MFSYFYQVRVRAWLLLVNYSYAIFLQEVGVLAAIGKEVLGCLVFTTGIDMYSISIARINIIQVNLPEGISCNGSITVLGVTDSPVS